MCRKNKYKALVFTANQEGKMYNERYFSMKICARFFIDF